MGLGLTLIQANNAVQTVLPKEDIPIGVTIVNFSQLVGGTVFVSICQAVLAQTLKVQLGSTHSGIDAEKISSAGATNITKLVPKEKLPLLLSAYNQGIVKIFYCALATACLAFVASFFLEWRSVKQAPNKSIDESGSTGDNDGEEV